VIKDGKTKKEVDTYSSATHPVTPLTIAPLEEQGELESRRAWSKVAAALAKGDYDLTTAEKSKIENEQRELRKKEAAEGIVWERRYFDKVDSEPRFAALAAKIGVAPEIEKTGNGMWVFNKAKYEATLKK